MNQHRHTTNTRTHCYAPWAVLQAYVAGVVHDGEVSLGAEVGLGVLGVLVVLAVHLLHIALVRGLGEPALLVQQRQDAHRLMGGGERGIIIIIFTGYSAQKTHIIYIYVQRTYERQILI